jgi:hypothetical protein
MDAGIFLKTLPDSDLARLCRVLVPLVITRSWDKAEQLVKSWEEIVAAGQEWYWTPEWQAWEAEADAELAAGNYDDFTTMDDLITDLEAAASGQ